MKRFLTFVLAVFMVVFCAGTAMAASSVELSTATSGVSQIFYGPTFSNADSGASAYVNTGGIATNATKLDSGTTLYAISDTKTNASGSELRATALQYISGATPLGSPQLISGTSDTVIVYLHAATNLGVGSGSPTLYGTLTGTTLYAIRGVNGTAYWSKGLYGFSAGPATGANSHGLYNSTAAGATFYSLAPVTIDSENTSYSGATIYGVIGGVSSVPAAGLKAGISVFAISAQSGDYSLTPAGKAAVTDIQTPLIAAYNNSGVSAVHAAPVVSGTSLFILGYGDTCLGVTLYQFNKNNIFNGFTAAVPVKVNNGQRGDQWSPTPAVSGSSIFVVEPRGGVTSFRTDNLAVNYTVAYTGGEVLNGVSAAPVTDGTYIVLCSSSSVTGYKVNNLSGNSKEWTYNFGTNTRYQIFSSPAISSGYVWVTVNDILLNTAATYRFTLSDKYNGAPTILANHGKVVYASPIIVGGNLWSAVYDPTVEKFTATGAYGEYYWPQFKFDKGKTGSNTASTAAAAQVLPGDDSGACFISTVR